MSEKTNILYLCVLIAISDYELQNEETHKIIKISKELKIDFNVHNAFEEIQNKFREDFDAACNFYLNNITTPKYRQLDLGEVRLYSVRDTFWMHWHLPAGQTLKARVHSNSPITEYVGRGQREKSGHVVYQGQSDGRLAFRTKGDDLNVEVNAGGDRLPAHRLKLGTALKSADDNPYRAERSYWWIINLILIQFLLVALPEEVFYRGYLQTRLDQIFPNETGA